MKLKSMDITEPYMSSFQEYPGKVTIEPYDKAADVATTPASCAKACIDESSFDCLTFQWCDATSTCLLYKSSYLSTKGSSQMVNTTKKCSLYKSKSPQSPMLDSEISPLVTILLHFRDTDAWIQV